MPDTLFIGILAIGLAILFLLWLRTVLLTQEIFKRLAQLENPIERATDQGEEPSSEDPETHDRVEKLLDDVATAAPDKMRRYQRFYGLVRLWSFLIPAMVTRLAPREISPIDVFRCAQEIISNPCRWCGYALAVDRWGRPVAVQFGGHAFSALGAFWRAVAGLEAQGYQFEKTYLDCLEALLAFAEQKLKGRLEPGNSLFAVTQYELAIRACTDEMWTAVSEILASKRKLVDETTGFAYGEWQDLKHVLFRLPRD